LDPDTLETLDPDPQPSAGRIPEEHLILGQRLVVENQGDRPLHLNKIEIF
jgi:hypothetical protein